MRSTVERAMKERLSVHERMLTVHSAWLEQLDAFQKLKQSVAQYQTLFLDEPEALMAEYEALVLNVPDDILGIDDCEFKRPAGGGHVAHGESVQSSLSISSILYKNFASPELEFTSHKDF